MILLFCPINDPGIIFAEFYLSYKMSSMLGEEVVIGDNEINVGDESVEVVAFPFNPVAALNPPTALVDEDSQDETPLESSKINHMATDNNNDETDYEDEEVVRDEKGEILWTEEQLICSRSLKIYRNLQRKLSSASEIFELKDTLDNEIENWEGSFHDKSRCTKDCWETDDTESQHDRSGLPARLEISVVSDPVGPDCDFPVTEFWRPWL